MEANIIFIVTAAAMLIISGLVLLGLAVIKKALDGFLD